MEDLELQLSVIRWGSRRDLGLKNLDSGVLKHFADLELKNFASPNGAPGTASVGVRF